VGEELDTRIEQRIRELMKATGSTDASSTVAALERDWRRLLSNRRLLQSEYDEDLSGVVLQPVRTEEVRINVVGQDGPLAPTPATSVHSEDAPPTTLVVTNGVTFD
jgi:hypothetical protein